MNRTKRYIPYVAIALAVIAGAWFAFSHRAFTSEFVLSLGTMLLAAIIPLLAYAISKCGADFTVRGFLLRSRKRLVLGFVLMAMISLVVTWIPETRNVFGVISSFIAYLYGVPAATSAAAGVSDFALGIIVGGLLVASVRGNDI